MMSSINKITPLNAMNLLQTKAIAEFVAKYRRQESRQHNNRWPQLTGLNIHLRQLIIDYITNEKINVSPKLIQSLIVDGLQRLDLWSLCETNTLTTTEIMAILETIAQNSKCLQWLSLGGNEWILNNKVIKGPLKRIFEGKLQQLVTLRMQSIASGEDLLAVLKSCPRLKRLEIRMPSITCRDIDRIESRLKTSTDVISNLKELLLPSSFKCRSLMKMLAIFSNIETLKCVSFEQLLDLIDLSVTISPNTSYSEMASLAKKTLSSLTSLTVTQAMSYDSIERLVTMCPKIQRLSLEVQDGMLLWPITRLVDLKHLELRNTPSVPIDLSNQVLPILEAKGKQLEALSLEYFDVIDLGVCTKMCSNLQRFSAQWFTTLAYPRPDMPSSLRDKALKEPFSGLTHVRLRPSSQRNIPSNACAFLLAAAKRVTHIELYCCFDLSDGDVQVLFSKNPMTHLRSLILRHGHKVTKEALNLLVSRADGLAFVDCGIPLKDE
ncbi:uncharacterized protein LOC128954986 [Oppia nitens]|uniref:uncharacterized protein LOC128954986 n=1 Tax=Oppia nitens TaxID=1686743 RepID=UPI0023DAF1F0|nr:uncharacterized protein LOC128954986 [Oppia nitens]